MTRVFESNGPDIKIRVPHPTLRKNMSSGARRTLLRRSGRRRELLSACRALFPPDRPAQEQFRQNQPQPRTENEMASEDGEDDSESFSNFGQEPGFVPVQQQPFVPRDNNNPQRDHQREGQPYQPREQHSPREHNNHREHRPQPQFQPPQPQPQPVIADNVSVDRLPSFITGPQPQINGGFEGGNGGERFPPRRRRRPHGPRPEGMATPVTPGDDFNPGNE